MIFCYNIWHNFASKQFKSFETKLSKPMEASSEDGEIGPITLVEAGTLASPLPLYLVYDIRQKYFADICNTVPSDNLVERDGVAEYFPNTSNISLYLYKCQATFQ